MIYMNCNHQHKTKSVSHLSETGNADLKIVCCAGCANWLTENMASFIVETRVTVALTPSPVKPAQTTDQPEVDCGCLYVKESGWHDCPNCGRECASFAHNMDCDECAMTAMQAAS